MRVCTWCLELLSSIPDQNTDSLVDIILQQLKVGHTCKASHAAA